MLIHEGQLTFARRGLSAVVDLGRWWKDETGLPLPLGGNVVRRDLGPDRIGRISRALSRSIEYGLAHRDGGARPRHAVRPRPRPGARRTGSSACTSTPGPGTTGAEGRRAVQLLLDRAHEAGLTPQVTAEYAP